MDTPNARFTLLFEAHAIEVLQAARSTTQACDLLKIGWSTAVTIMKRGVERGLERRDAEDLERIGMDEPEHSGDRLPEAARRVSAANQKSFRAYPRYEARKKYKL